MQGTQIAVHYPGKMKNKLGVAQVGAISKLKNRKRTSKCQFTVLEKNGPSGAPGPPGALKGGHFRNCQHFCRS